MTVIAYRNGVMAADSMVTQEGDVKMMNSVKIICRKGWMLAVSGNLCPPDRLVMDWFFNVEDLDAYSREPMPRFKFDMLTVTPAGKMQLWDQKGFFEPLNTPFYAIGAGGHYAMGAMEVGANAIQAVRAAIKWSPTCGGKIVVRRLRKTGG
jgi:hypothetical protein